MLGKFNGIERSERLNMLALVKHFTRRNEIEIQVLHNRECAPNHSPVEIFTHAPFARANALVLAQHSDYVLREVFYMQDDVQLLRRATGSLYITERRFKDNAVNSDALRLKNAHREPAV